LTDAGLDNHRDLQRIVALANALPPGSLDFALLPGDNADDGTAEQFALVRDALAPLTLPVHVIPGDHDFKLRSLEAYHGVLGAAPLPYAAKVKGHRCLFLDVVSAGTGGPDFRMDAGQLDWMERELDGAAAAHEGVAVFMHTYPADLREGRERLGALLSRPEVLCVDMGHTHYNELANDGGTVFMATRSTGQVEEGPAGFSIAAVDGRAVSWRFKALDAAWPFVLVTQPADRRLMTGASQAVDGPFGIRAQVYGDQPVTTVKAQVDGGGWVPMRPIPGAPAGWALDWPTAGQQVRVRARDTQGREDTDAADLAVPGWTPPQRAADGSDRDRIGAWEARGILDTQLGPNRKGKKW